jgi:hypothetical protein
VHRVVGEELPDLDTYVIDAADREDGSGEALLLMVSLSSYDEQDRALGQDTYCISTAQGATIYGGLTRCVLQFDSLTLGFEPEAAHALEVPLDIILPLRVDPADIRILYDGLRRVLERASTPVSVISYL